MSRATGSYIVMLCLLCGGLWAIIDAGRSMRAPAAISGEWLSLSDESGDAARSLLRIDQSGRFVRLAFPVGRLIQAKMLTEEIDGSDSSEVVKMAFSVSDGFVKKFSIELHRLQDRLSIRGPGIEADQSEWRRLDLTPRAVGNH